MGHPLKFESPSSASAGIYRQNAFYVKMQSIFDLDPAFGDPPPFAVAMHAHEYVHFLHNASTTAGQAYLLSNLALVRALSEGCDDQGYFVGPDAMTDEGRERLKYTVAMMHRQLGSTAASQFAECKDLHSWDCSAPQVSIVEEVPEVRCVFSASDSSETPRSQSVAVGLSFITEGIAYEVDREMRRLAGMADDDLDKQTVFFPYLAYGFVLRRWSGRELSAQDRIAIGACALGHLLSGVQLANICHRLKSTQLPVSAVLDGVFNECRDVKDAVLAGLREHRSDLSTGKVIQTAIDEYLKIAEAGIRLRELHPVPEFSFINRPLTAEEFRGRMGAMLDCLVIQCKPERALDMYWIGPGVAAATNEAAERLGALQSALHFSQLHLVADGSVAPTAALKTTQCPFSGGCQTEKSAQHPSECRTAPWKRFTPSLPGEQVCWYAAGVKALRNPERTAVHSAARPA